MNAICLNAPLIKTQSDSISFFSSGNSVLFVIASHLVMPITHPFVNLAIDLNLNVQSFEVLDLIFSLLLFYPVTRHWTSLQAKNKGYGCLFIRDSLTSSAYNWPGPAICILLNENSNYCHKPRSSKNIDTCKCRTGYSATASCIVYAVSLVDFMIIKIWLSYILCVYQHLMGEIGEWNVW